MKIPENIKATMNAALAHRRIALATASKECLPNVVPIGSCYAIGDDILVLVDNYFLKTRKNMEANPWVSISFWDTDESSGKPITTAGFQMKGKAISIETSGQLYEETKAKIKAIRADSPVKAIMRVKIEEIFDVKAGPNAGKKVA